jgi:hypothetical protein
MTVADKIIFNHSRSTGGDVDRGAMGFYAACALLVMILIYASASLGTDAAEIAAMSVFP